MAFGFPAFHKDRKTLTLSVEETKAIAIEILVEFEWTEIGIHPFALDYKTETYKTYKRRNPCVDNLEEKKVMNKMQSNSEIQKAFSKKELFISNLTNPRDKLLRDDGSY